MTDLSPAKKAARAWAAAGAFVVLATSLLGQGFGALVFGVYALLPYALLLALPRLTEDEWVVGGAGAAALSCELGVRAFVFLWPRGSTSALALLFSPVFIAVAMLPAGAAAGRMLGFTWRLGGRAARGAVAAVAATALGLTFLFFAKPDKFPTALWKTKKALEAIGEPRVALGAEAFESAPIPGARGWFFAAPLGPGGKDRVVAVDSDIALYDPATLALESRLPFEAGGRGWWSWYSTLTRVAGKPVIVQTGGGFSETSVLDLSAAKIWSYNPDFKLPPAALKPADLDGDGETEFYAASARKLARLDASGREVWSSAATSPQLAGLLPKRDGFPSWALAYEYARRAFVVDDAGKPLGELPLKSGSWPVAAVDLGARRGVLMSGEAARVVSLSGAELLNAPLPGLSVVLGVSARLRPGEGPSLAVLAAAPRDVKRWELVVYSPEGKPVYSEVLASPPRVFSAARGDGADGLFLGDESGLRALRPRK